MIDSPDDLFSQPVANNRDAQLQERGGMAEELADCYGPPVARHTDPETSHKAAKAVTPAADTIREDVNRWAMGRGANGFIDEELSAAFDATDSSSYRTRRAELTQAGMIVDSRRRRANSNMRQCIVWVHKSYSTLTPDFERPLTLAEKLERHANRLDENARQMRAEGRTAFAGELKETAALIREALQAGRKRAETAS